MPELIRGVGFDHSAGGRGPIRPGAAVRVGTSHLGGSTRAAGGSGCGAVLVDEPAAGGVASDRLAWPIVDDVVGVVGCALVEAAVGSVGVVVLEVLVEQSSELAFVPDDRAVEELVAQRANPPLGERVRLRCPWRDPDRGDPAPANTASKRG